MRIAVDTGVSRIGIGATSVRAVPTIKSRRQQVSKLFPAPLLLDPPLSSQVLFRFQLAVIHDACWIIRRSLSFVSVRSGCAFACGAARSCVLSLVFFLSRLNQVSVQLSTMSTLQ